MGMKIYYFRYIIAIKYVFNTYFIINVNVNVNLSIKTTIKQLKTIKKPSSSFIKYLILINHY